MSLPSLGRVGDSASPTLPAPSPSRNQINQQQQTPITPNIERRPRQGVRRSIDWTSPSSSTSHSNSSDLEHRLVTLEKACQRLVDMVGSTPTTATLAAQLDTLSQQVGSIEGRVRIGCEDRLGAGLQDAEVRTSTQIKRMEVKLNKHEANIKTLQEQIKNLQRGGNHTTTGGGGGGVATASGDSSTVVARIDQVEIQLTAERERHSTDFSHLSTTLEHELTRTHTRLTHFDSERHIFEEGFKRYILRFQNEFRSIIQTLQKSMFKSHHDLEKVLKAEIESRLEHESTSSTQMDSKFLQLQKDLSSETKLQQLHKDLQQLRQDQTKILQEFGGRLVKALEQARSASTTAAQALAKSEQSLTDATAAKEIASRTAVRVAAQGAGVNSAARQSIISVNSPASTSSPNSPSSGGVLLTPSSTTFGSTGHSTHSGGGGGHHRSMSSMVDTRIAKKRPSLAPNTIITHQKTLALQNLVGTNTNANTNNNNNNNNSNNNNNNTNTNTNINTHSNPTTNKSTPVSTPKARIGSSASPDDQTKKSGEAAPESTTISSSSSIVHDAEWAALRIQSMYRGFGVRRQVALAQSDQMPFCDGGGIDDTDGDDLSSLAVHGGVIPALVGCGGKNRALKRCIDCEKVLCQHCEQLLHQTSETRQHSRQYLIMKARSTTMKTRTIVRQTDGDDDDDENVSLASPSSPSTATTLATFEGPHSKFQRGDLLLATLDTIAASIPPTTLFEPLMGKVVQVAVGRNHAGAITEAGQLWMWGDNSFGQVGTGDRIHRLDPTHIPLNRAPPSSSSSSSASGLRVLEVSCGTEHTLARVSDGSSFSWGSGMLGRLGHRSDEDCEIPKEVTTLPRGVRVVQIETGEYNSAWLCQVDQQQMQQQKTGLEEYGEKESMMDPTIQLFISGANEEGQCGIGNRIPQLTPAMVRITPTTTSSSSSSSSSSVPSASSSLIHITRIAFGAKHGILLTSNGDAYAFGSHEFGQLGTKVTTPKSIYQLTPTPITTLAQLKQHATEVVCGERHTHILTKEGQVWSFGSGESHQQGVFDNVDQFFPVRVSLPGPVSSLSTGSTVTYAVLETGDVYGWGFGLETPIPKLQESLRDRFIQQIQIGANDMIAVLTGMAQECSHWLFNANQGDGVENIDGSPSMMNGPEPFDALRGRRLQSLSVGSTHYGFIDGSGRLLVCGENNDYQLGTGNTIEMTIPITITMPISLTTIVCASMHSIALGVDGTVWCWGNSMSGRCGTGTDGDVMRPTLLETIRHVPMKFITASQYNSGCISREGGEVYAWGASDGAQIGIPGFQPQLYPIKVPLINPTSSEPFEGVTISFGNKHTVVVGSSGHAITFGSNEFGQLGLGRLDQPGSNDGFDADDGTGGVGGGGRPLQHPPTHVALLQNQPLAAAVAGENCTFFLTRTGKVYSCGSGETSQLGHGAGNGVGLDVGMSLDDQPFPTLIRAFEDARVAIRQLTIGTLNCAAVTTEGRVWVWGWACGETPTEVEYYKEKDIKLISCGLNDLVCCT